jgi:hypothetical protein
VHHHQHHEITTTRGRHAGSKCLFGGRSGSLSTRSAQRDAIPVSVGAGVHDDQLRRSRGNSPQRLQLPALDSFRSGITDSIGSLTSPSSRRPGHLAQLARLRLSQSAREPGAPHIQPTWGLSGTCPAEGAERILFARQRLEMGGVSDKVPARAATTSALTPLQGYEISHHHPELARFHPPAGYRPPASPD